MKRIVTCLSLVLITTGCVSYPIARYPVATRNIMDLKKITQGRNIKVSLGKFTLEGKENSNKFICRGAPLYVSGQETIGDYVKKALQSELELAGLYVDSGGISVEINFKEIKLTTGVGYWKYQSVVTVNGIRFPFNYDHRFKSSFLGDFACRNAAATFPDSVQDFIGNLIRNKIFQKIMQ